MREIMRNEMTRSAGRLAWQAFALLILSFVPLSAVSAAPPDDDTFVDYYKEYTDDKSMHIYTSTYDYAPLAREITAACTTDYQRIKAIYYWVCDNIDYDTSYEIYKADSCIVYKKGVCQAYCELFYHLSKAVGIRTEVVGGYSKNQHGFVSGSGHSWLFVYTRDKHGIFMDPTWGAGIMEKHQFVRNKDYWQWFNVEPEWLILTHYPDNEVYQMIDRPVTFEEFRAMPVANPLWRTYGLKVHDIYQMVRNDSVSLPRFFNRGEGVFEIVDVPMCASLKIGHRYTFRVRKMADGEFAIVNGGVYSKEDQWRNEGNGIYAIDFMPRVEGSIHLGLKSETKTDYWDYLLEYTLDPPTPSDWAEVEKVYPLCAPDVKGVSNLNGSAWEQAGINGHELLRLIRQHQVRSLPILYQDKGQRLQIISVPMDKILARDHEYTFQFRPQSGEEWAIVNEGVWWKTWKINDGVYTMTVKPKTSGSLALYVKMGDSGKFWTCLEYLVR